MIIAYLQAHNTIHAKKKIFVVSKRFKDIFILFDVQMRKMNHHRFQTVTSMSAFNRNKHTHTKLHAFFWLAGWESFNIFTNTISCYYKENECVNLYLSCCCLDEEKKDLPNLCPNSTNTPTHTHKQTEQSLPSHSK